MPKKFPNFCSYRPCLLPKLVRVHAHIIKSCLNVCCYTRGLSPKLITKSSRQVVRRSHAEWHLGMTYPKPHWPKPWPPCRGWMTTSFSISCPIDPTSPVPLSWPSSFSWGWMTSKFSIPCPWVPTCPIWVPYLIPMASKRHLWSTNLALYTYHHHQPVPVH